MRKLLATTAFFIVIVAVNSFHDDPTPPSKPTVSQVDKDYSLKHYGDASPEGIAERVCTKMQGGFNDTPENLQKAKAWCVSEMIKTCKDFIRTRGYC